MDCLPPQIWNVRSLKRLEEEARMALTSEEAALCARLCSTIKTGGLAERAMVQRRGSGSGCDLTWAVAWVWIVRAQPSRGGAAEWTGENFEDVWQSMARLAATWKIEKLLCLETRPRGDGEMNCGKNRP
ncbi:hypothetical protein DL98DRAFT_158520 [Cadophora sp. DSE1049]|nr:hypothetical protein DL98DRAFT_158520 [Cadophora sp. DSE1049]